MRTAAVLAAAFVASAPPLACADGQPLSSVTLPVHAADLAAALRLRRSDPSRLPLDTVRIAWATRAAASDEERAGRAALLRIFSAPPVHGDAIPLPFTADVWRTHLLHADVADEALAAAIFTSRDAALLYYGFMGVDDETRVWMAAHPGALHALRRHPGATAAFARSLRVRDDRVITPGPPAAWEKLVGVPAHPAEAFVAALVGADDGRLFALYDGIAHLDAQRQDLAAGDPQASSLGSLAATNRRAYIKWTAEDRPFDRELVDVPLLMRALRFDQQGRIASPASADVWHAVFQDARLSRDGRVMTLSWLAEQVVGVPAPIGRARLDTVLFGQRVFGTGAPGDADLLQALRGFSRYPALMLTLERDGLRDPRVFAEAARTASSLRPNAVPLFQAALALADRATLAGTLDAAQCSRLVGELLRASNGPDAIGGIGGFVERLLLPAFGAALHLATDVPLETVAIAGLAGPVDPAAPLVEFEGHRYRLDAARGARQRLERARRNQHEIDLDTALAADRRRQDLLSSLMGLVYAAGLDGGDEERGFVGRVWRRHAFAQPTPQDEAFTWRVASESYLGGSWHLVGSALLLDAALPEDGLHRVDTTALPSPSYVSLANRRVIALTVALAAPDALTDEDRDAIDRAWRAGRARIDALSGGREAIDDVARDAGLSEWRRSAIGWLAGAAPNLVADAFTPIEITRLGGLAPRGRWGAVTAPLDTCLCLRVPDAPPEEFGGRTAIGLLGTQVADFWIEIARALAVRRLPGLLARGIAAFAVRDVLDTAQAAYFDDYLSLAFAARDLPADRYDDYIAALTVSGPLVPVAEGKEAAQ